ncbi:MAG: phytanoyl-CoA dioxygenase family protein [Pseudomonadota bacterium]
MPTAAAPSIDPGAYFNDNGYYLARGVYSDAALQSMEAAFDRVVEQLLASGENTNARWASEHTDKLDGGESKILHTHNVQRYSSVWLDALRDPAFLDVAEQILGPDIVLHHTKLFLKPPNEGAPFPMHQDWTYFPTCHDTMMAGVILLSDADATTGGLCVYPGSHKLGRIENSSGRVPCAELSKYPLDGATPINGKRGDVVFFSYLTLHGSTPNRSTRPRKTVLVQLHSGDDTLEAVDGHRHVNESLVLRGWNSNMSRSRADT